MNAKKDYEKNHDGKSVNFLSRLVIKNAKPCVTGEFDLFAKHLHIFDEHLNPVLDVSGKMIELMSGLVNSFYKI